MIEGVRIRPTGGMDTDSSLYDIGRGNYISAEHIRMLTDEGSDSFEVQNIKGNKWIVTTPTAGKTRKKQRIYVDISAFNGTGSETWTFQLYDNYANLKSSKTAVVDGTSASNTSTNIQAAISAAVASVSGWTVSYSTNVTGTIIVVDILISAGNPYAEFYIYAKSPANSVSTLVVNTIAESVDDGITGLLRPLAGFEIEGKLFLLSSTKNGMPYKLENVKVVGATNASPIVITLSQNHPLSSGQQAIYAIDGVEGNTAANGAWLCEYVSPTQLKLIQSTGNGAFATSLYSSVTVDVMSLSEIGVVERNINTDQTKYTTLLRSKNLGLRACNMIDLRGEISSDKYSLYWTDFNEPIRCWYHKTVDFVSNGSIFDTLSNKDGLYTYDSVAEETKLILSNTSARFGFKQVYQSGGQNLAGNHVQFIRFLTDSLSETDWIGPGMPINIYKATYSDVNNTEDAKKIFGDDSLAVTSKIIEIYIRDIPPIFKYVEVADIIYSGSDSIPVKTVVLPRILLSGESEISVKITGTENATDLDIGTLNRITANYDVAENIRALQNRLVISNIKTPNIYDFTEWFQTFKHSLGYYELPSVENNLNGINYGNPQKYNIGEFQLEDNVNSRIGYMLNETYRFFGVVEYTNGSLSQGYWIDDIKIDCDTTVARRNAALSSYKYSTYTTVSTPDGTVILTKLLVPFVKFMDFNINSLVGGKRVRDIVKRIHIYRCQVDNPTVMASGFVIPCVTNRIESSPQGTLIPEHTGLPVGSTIIEYPWIGDNCDLTFNVPSSLSYPGPSISAPITHVFTEKRRYGSFYSWDILSGIQNIEPLPTDKLIVIGQPGKDASLEILKDNDAGNIYVKYSGRTDTSNDPSSTQQPDILDVLEGGMCDPNGSIRLNSGADTVVKSFSKTLNVPYVIIPPVPTTMRAPKSLIVRTATDISPVTSPGSDNGFYLAQYYRPQTSQYGDKFSNKIIPTNAYIEITNQTPAIIGSDSSVVVFGGDTFTNTCFLKMLYNEGWIEGNTHFSKYPSSQTALRFISQNRANFSMRFKSNTKKSDGSDPITDNYPNTLVKYYDEYLTELESYFNGDLASEPLAYNKGYSVRKLYDIYSKSTFNPNEIQSTSEQTSIAWSPKKLTGSNVDSYRNFLPLDKKILDFSFGAIDGMEVINGEIFTFQPRQFKRHFFNTDGLFTTQEGSEIITGSGGVMARREQDLSRFGANNKWGIIKGSTRGGKDSVYWISGIHKKIVRFDPSQGTTVITDLQNLESFVFNNLKWTIQWDAPLTDGGISSVWNPRFWEAIWCVLARRDMPAWVLPDDPSFGYDTGEVVYHFAQSARATNQTGGLFRSLIDNNANEPPAPGTSNSYWQSIPVTDKEYYNYWNLVYSEGAKENAFRCFQKWYSPLMIPAWDSFVSVDPTQGRQGDIYVHNEGNYCQWFSKHDEGVYEDGYVEFVVNKYADIEKAFEAIWLNTKIAPKKVYFRTERFESYLDESDFEFTEDGYWSPIKNDSTVTINNPDGRNDLDTSWLFGKYLIVKVIFEKGVKQTLRNAVVKINTQNLNVNQ